MISKIKAIVKLCMLVPGLFQIIGAGVWDNNCDTGSLTRSWSFALGITSGVMLMISGIAYAIIAGKNHYSMKPEIPCRNQDQEGMRRLVDQ